MTNTNKRGSAVLEGGFWFFVMLVPMLLGYIMLTLVVGLAGIGGGLLMIPPAAYYLRWLADLRRKKVRQWRGIEIPRPYRAEPEFGPGFAGYWQRIRFHGTDPAFWRDGAWVATDPVVGAGLAVVPIGLVLEGLYGIVISAMWSVFVDHGFNDWFGFVHVHHGNDGMRWAPAALGVLEIALGFAVAPKMLEWHARWSRVLLAPTPAQVEARMKHLTQTRADAVDTQAAELRRIERDLHDGAQARLVAMGMHLNAASQLMQQDPEAAQKLLMEARDSSAKALSELRDLVRGIHPPVLADRGLVDAVRATALDSPLEIDVHAEVPGRLDLPLESAAYFAVSEVLTNVAKHAHASQAWIDMRVVGGLLKITVSDNGIGGADADKGSGLHGIERRLATFDGILALSSPPGGPTVVTMELPCVSSSPKTSSSSGTA
ncbi:sensor domain-containing protein [Catenulispora sp. NF23]|uniref:histidine kinase n=1 Tax=Catenulispora pinistramenti TaxID=2705254 RepID=A0ABS5L2R0_9ACTN|nr:sensor histidine kinase [Catenulispora pinistramenti]MBS2536146.1 sensor domain-containing protein [Catenulispora pinistramenti]MBS2552605.1 sensor domain-containing protein [Catenulispora pinistramenti]